ncbi:hypothetical protein [Streptomyces sp. NPDC001137]|uniref:hypothetical protein n=1 Tax=Streptomyces sp. NPDC001137 TaxID=3154378 RepID=UPI00332D7902
MLAESLAALAAAGGTAVVQCAGTDAWAMVRERVARLLGGGDVGREARELDRLDQTGRALSGDSAADRAQVVRWESAWQTRLELFLETLAGPEQAAAADELRRLVADAHPHAAGRVVRAGEGGVAAGGEVSVQASQQSVAGAVVRVEGGIHLSPFPTAGDPQQPPPPRPSRGF